MAIVVFASVVIYPSKPDFPILDGSMDGWMNGFIRCNNRHHHYHPCLRRSAFVSELFPMTVTAGSRTNDLQGSIAKRPTRIHPSTDIPSAAAGRNLNHVLQQIRKVCQQKFRFVPMYDIDCNSALSGLTLACVASRPSSQNDDMSLAQRDIHFTD
mmetsp:Transcript_965/g.2464  ORF Transcript_965/g.2464 Transcript_965/m.2464 type:complete len:155 (-) Transcript_965:2686-3150(-)